MTNLLTYRGVVVSHDCNELNHMTMTQYVEKFDQAGRRAFLELGLKRKEVVAIEQTTKYVKETQEGDLIDIRTTLLDVADKTITLLHKMYNAQTEELVGRMNIVYANFDMRSKRAVSFTITRRAQLADAIDL